MANPGRRADAAVIDQLRAEPWRFEFFQAVRLLDQLARTNRRGADGTSAVPHDELPRTAAPLVGTDTSPEEEIVRFLASVSASFSAAAIQGWATPSGGDRAPGIPPHMIVNFLGLTGPSGVLPQHYTSLLMEQHRANEHCLAAFQDIFNHRAISLFYRAWEKYRFVVSYERLRRRRRAQSGTEENPQMTQMSQMKIGAQRLPHLRPSVSSVDDSSSSVPSVDDISQDVFTNCLLGLAGYAVGRAAARLAFDPQVLVYFAGHFSRRARNVVSLEAVLSDYFEAPAAVEQFTGSWQPLAEHDQSRLPDPAARDGLNAGLGQTLTVGQRVFLVGSRFRVVLGPLTLEQYLEMLPIGRGLAVLAQLVRLFARAEFDFDVQLMICAAEVPPCKLGDQPDAARLGWTSFLSSEKPKQDARGARFLYLDVWSAAAAPRARRAAG